MKIYTVHFDTWVSLYKFGFFKRLNWYRLSYKVIVEWPPGDPNDIWRDWLETKVGKQGLTWDWRLSDESYTQWERSKIEVGFNNPMKATWFSMRWA